MTEYFILKRFRILMVAGLFFVFALLATSVAAQQISLQSLVTPSTVITKNDQPVAFAIHAFIEFKSLSEVFPYIDSQMDRWKPQLSAPERQNLAAQLLRQGIESRVISMIDERPLETILTHTEEELTQAINNVKEPMPSGYAETFLAVQKKWKHALNGWSASSYIPGRVLSNWYPIEEGVVLFGATYDSTEHFWQAVKFHPDTTIKDLTDLLDILEKKDWRPWLASLDANPKLYLPNAYAVEFLRVNLSTEHLQAFRKELSGHGLQPTDHARYSQQRIPEANQIHAQTNRLFRFTAPQEKILWGDLADLFYLIYTFSPQGDPLRKVLADHHFDYVYLGERKMGFISEEFRSVMLEVFKVKYLQISRFREVITGIPQEIRIEHYLNGGDSPDIPIPIYVGYLNQIRDLARVK